MSNLFTIKVEFHNQVAFQRKNEFCSLVENFNQQNNTEIDWFGNFCDDLGVSYLQFQGSDDKKTTNCAQFVCETINEGSSLPLIYIRGESELHIMVH